MEKMESTPSTVSPLLPAEVAEQQRRKQRGRIATLATATLFLLFAVSAVGFGVASALEEDDRFCISCHTIPETTYYNRAYIAYDHLDTAPVDLASRHYQLAALRGEAFQCIACHRGDSSLGHRLATIALASKDTAIWFAGREDPTVEKSVKSVVSAAWLPNAACAACHSATLLNVAGLDNHFHTHLPQASRAAQNGGTLIFAGTLKGDRQLLQAQWLAPIEAELTCTSCHLAHQAYPNVASQTFIDPDRRNQACVACHLKAGQGPQDIATLGR